MTARGTSSRHYDSGWGTCESLRGLPDLQFVVEASVQLTFLGATSFARKAGVVETRRLELLTLSLQRRCSSD
jgi:hypothetical protein